MNLDQFYTCLLDFLVLINAILGHRRVFANASISTITRWNGLLDNFLDPGLIIIIIFFGLK